MFDPVWWQRDGLRYVDGRLYMAQQDLLQLVQRCETPLFVYDSARVRDNLQRLHSALESQQLDYRIFYALKANRFAPLIAAMRHWGLCGIDACSPGELLLARQHGFAENEISYTGTSVANSDLDLLARHPGVHINCDSLSTIRRLGERDPGRRIGIRINPRVGAGFGLQNLAAYYQTPFVVAPLAITGTNTMATVTVAGHINEAIDLLAEDVDLPPLREGDYLAFLNAGGYGASSSSNHCMRGAHSEFLVG